MRGLSIRLFWNRIGEAHADPEWPESFKNTTNVYSIHLELRMALPCQINVGKWIYVNPCLDFLGIPDQRTAYVKWRVRPGWTYVRRSSVTPDLVTIDWHQTACKTLTVTIFIIHKSMEHSNIERLKIELWNNVKPTSQRRWDVIMTLLRHVSTGCDTRNNKRCS